MIKFLNNRVLRAININILALTILSVGSSFIFLLKPLGLSAENLTDRQSLADFDITFIDDNSRSWVKTRDGLFRSGSSMNVKPLANKTIQKILSQLKLQCIMKINDKPAAYIKIKGSGLKKCQQGQNVENMFTVLDIYEDSIDLSILDHRVTLAK